MKQHKKNEAGAIMIEILAVLALIGVMGPMLFRQVMDRNKEISNVNIASEMRTIKEAVSAYIAADGAALGRKCLGSTGEADKSKYCGVISENDLESFLPVGMEGILKYYTVKSYAYWIEYGTTGVSDLRPFVYGVVVSNGDGQPQDWNFRRAARVASLIGADGGVVVDAHYTGTSGAWELPVIDRTNIQDDSVVATTAFDTFEPDLGIVAPNAVYAPDSLAFKRLHAWNYFSVGDKDAKMAGHCFRQIRMMDSDKTLPDEIYNVSQSVDGSNCDPLFWVGASGSGNDKSKDGYVYAKKNVYVGRDNANDRSAIALETNTSVANGTINDPLANKERRIVVYDTMGNAKVTIDGTGTIIADKLMSDRTTKVQVTDDNNTRMKDSYYGVDPKNTSVLEDVRLGSRGGARLSDILPNYIAKNVFTLENGRAAFELSGVPYTGSIGSYGTGTTTSRAYWYIPQPSCPTSYAAAVILTPLKWKNSTLEDIITPAQLLGYRAKDPPDAGTHNMTAPAGGGPLTGAIMTYPQSMSSSGSYQKITTKTSRKELHLGASTSGTNFYIQAGYLTSDVTSTALPTSEIIVQAQTFCVYKGNKAKATDTLDSDKNP